ncbi:MAG: peptidoglycan DD-metalloendopeptidase family protein [Pseudomonadales bacterium]
MKIILIRGIEGRSSAISVSAWARAAISCCLLGLPMGVGFWLGSEFGESESHFFDQVAEALEADLAEQQQEVVATREEAEQRLQAMTLRIAQMQAKLSRLEALGELLTTKAELDDGEFDFSSAPALGGPVDDSYSRVSSESETLSMLDELGFKLEDRAIQLDMMAELIRDREITRENSPSGLPASRGWVSSNFGMRADPFNGQQAWHNGVDIAGKLGTDILSVAAGVVTFAGERYGYGQLVEVTHENGYVTRYGHNSKILVELGEIVQKGQILAAMGSTGRSTGPHIHFEVYKNGRAVDPASYIRRTIR